MSERIRVCLIGLCIDAKAKYIVTAESADAIIAAIGGDPKKQIDEGLVREQEMYVRLCFARSCAGLPGSWSMDAEDAEVEKLRAAKRV